MSVSPHKFLEHIRDEIDYALEARRNKTLDDFFRDETLKRAFCRSVEIIGEAVKRVPDDIKAQRPEVPWQSIARMRDRLIHHYFGVDYEIVWMVVDEELPKLRDAITALLNTTQTDVE